MIELPYSDAKVLDESLNMYDNKISKCFMILNLH